MSTAITDSYEAKPSRYFGGCRADYVDALPANPEAAILEIGSAHGNTGALALTEGKCGRFVGIELSPTAAEESRAKLSEVHVGNIEHMDLPFAAQSFDALIISEVLEHLVDPWAVLDRVAPLIKPGGLVFASSPNISHYSIIKELVMGRWELTDVGAMDRTHLRWFTPTLYAQMFDGAGFEVEEVRPVVPHAPRVQMINRLTRNRFRHLFMRQISIRARRRG